TKGFSDSKSKHELLKDKNSREAFKLKQHGIRKDLTASYYLTDLALDKNRYLSRKSYRQFSSKSLSITKHDLFNSIRKKSNSELLNIPNLDNNTGINEIKWIQLQELLGTISAIKLNDRILPKYLYPSGGSAYPIQCYVTIPKTLNDKEVLQGDYYYEPVSHFLAKVEDRSKLPKQNAESNNAGKPDQIELCFKLYTPAIELLYESETALRLAWLELGHMVLLIKDKVEDLQLKAEINILNDVQGDYRNLIKISISPYYSSNKSSSTSSGLYEAHSITDFDFLKNTGNGFHDEDGKSFNLSNENVFFRTSEIYSILDVADGLVVFKGSSKPEDLIKSGYLAQKMTENLLVENIGSCSLGTLPYDKVNYCMAIGSISNTQKISSESRPIETSFTSVMHKCLEKYLPVYMLPEIFMPIEEIPLSHNGKIEYKKLPKAHLKTHEFVPPSNVIESEICNIWKHHLKVENIGITDDFFRIGGNSITAIRALHEMNKVLDYEIKISEMFKYKTIKKLLNNTEFSQMDADNVDWEI
ncbi:phosphopantetheine-binding protein, partial [Croceitalea sp. MTPC5]|uniref:phosphopantetheine-binding protein n=1 Tax=Croceitalea sp. MTPC5 TaxID=3056565 RepID=UPI0030CBE7FB